ncbi:MAG: glycosyltransferase family 4 protein [Gemmatimonadetes bacterium]|nr:glycosyltransferase family 4 protein [Gemmatimonadota bacterium]MBP6669803.1 glycosyltransferase family 4 protein [Gemmatimonadales bacterium]MBK6779291.1 glycosyltransferase family 4 protein [Gemmatimonadota bacterium]MBK7348396.1 glycosyltransferase family 4 protein [Gemmatimonadota bacterium]MBK7713966.1 glycosyltransferase family 4 protein [Gemmatimonadota bacterium]
MTSPAPAPIVYLWDAEYPWDVRTEKVCRSLAAAGHEVHLVARNRSRATASERLPEGTVHRLSPLPWLPARVDGLLQFPAFFNPRWAGLTRRVLRESRARLLIVRDLPLAPLALRVAAPLGIPVLFDMAEDYPALLQTTWDAGRHGALDYLVRNPRLAAGIERGVLPRMSHTMVVVEESRDRLVAAGVPPARVSVVSNTPPLSRLSATPPGSRPAGQPVEAVYLGIVELPRGIGRLVEAAALLHAARVPVRLTVIGGGRDLALVQEQAAARGLPPERLAFTGQLPHEAALARVAAADIGLVPHLRNPWMETTIPNKLFDFMAAGLPVVTSDAAPLARVVREAGCGLLAADAAPQALASAIGTLAVDPALRARMAAAGREAIRTRYHWEADERVLRELVRRLASEEAP